MTTCLPGWRHPHIWEGAPLVAYKQSPKQCDKEAVVSNQVVYIISCQGLCAHNEWLYPEFQFTATNFMSMAAKLSNLINKMPGANLQADGQVEVATQGAKDLWGQRKQIVPFPLTVMVPCLEAIIRPPQCKILFRDTSNFDGRIGGCTPTFSLLDGPTGGRYVVRSKNWTYQSHGDRPR